MKKFLKKHPFFCLAISFLGLALIAYVYQGEDTIISSTFLILYMFTFIIWVFVWSPYNFYKFVKDERSLDKKKNLNSFFIWFILLLLSIIPIVLVELK